MIRRCRRFLVLPRHEPPPHRRRLPTPSHATSSPPLTRPPSHRRVVSSDRKRATAKEAAHRSATKQPRNPPPRPIAAFAAAPPPPCRPPPPRTSPRVVWFCRGRAAACLHQAGCAARLSASRSESPRRRDHRRRHASPPAALLPVRGHLRCGSAGDQIRGAPDPALGAIACQDAGEPPPASTRCQLATYTSLPLHPLPHRRLLHPCAPSPCRRLLHLAASSPRRLALQDLGAPTPTGGEKLCPVLCPGAAAWAWGKRGRRGGTQRWFPPPVSAVREDDAGAYVA